MSDTGKLLDQIFFQPARWTLAVLEFAIEATAVLVNSARIAH